MTGLFEIVVATETGSNAVIDVGYDSHRDTYTVQFTGELIDQRPEALTAAVQMAFLAIRRDLR